MSTKDSTITRISFKKIFRVDKMPNPVIRIPWEESNDEEEEKKEEYDNKTSMYDILIHEKRFLKRLREIQTWMYASENTIDKRSRYAEAVNHQGIVGCSVLHDGILENTSEALIKFSKRLENLNLSSGTYGILGSHSHTTSSNSNVVREPSPFLCDFVWGPLNTYIQAFRVCYQQESRNFSKYQHKILDLQRRLKNHLQLLGQFEQRTRIRIFQIKAAAEHAQVEYDNISKRLQRERMILESGERSSVSEKRYETISGLENRKFQAACRRNRTAASLFFELPRCQESMEYILMRLKVLEQERCQITAHNVKWVASRISTMITSIVEVCIFVCDNIIQFTFTSHIY